MSEQPTEAQIKEFWEWCGFRDVHYNLLGAVNEKWAGRLKLNEYWRYIPIDLNSLFLYAVPKLDYIGILMNVAPSGDVFWNVEAKYCGNTKRITNIDPALALFWAMWEVIKNE